MFKNTVYLAIKHPTKDSEYTVIADSSRELFTEKEGESLEARVQYAKEKAACSGKQRDLCVLNILEEDLDSFCRHYNGFKNSFEEDLLPLSVAVYEDKWISPQASLDNFEAYWKIEDYLNQENLEVLVVIEYTHENSIRRFGFIETNVSLIRQSYSSLAYLYKNNDSENHTMWNVNKTESEYPQFTAENPVHLENIHFKLPEGCAIRILNTL